MFSEVEKECIWNKWVKILLSISYTSGQDKRPLNLLRRTTQEHHSVVFIVNFEHISHPVLVFLSLTLNK